VSRGRALAFLRTGAGSDLSRVDASRVILLNSFALVAGLGSVGGLFAPSTYTEPVLTASVFLMISASIGVFLLHARREQTSAAFLFISAALIVTMLPPLFVSPWGGHLYNLVPLAALPWLLVTSSKIWVALLLAFIPVAGYIIAINVYELAYDMLAVRGSVGDFVFYMPLIIVILTITIGYFTRRIAVSAELALEQERMLPMELVTAMLPGTIAEQVAKGENIGAERFGDVSVLFCAVHDFRSILNEGSGEEAITLLDALHSKFDNLCNKYEVEKIKAFGQRYLVVAGVPHRTGSHAEDLAALALDMHRVARSFYSKSNAQIRLRIGINSGPLVTGVIGRSRLTYDVWGDTVNMAQRMELHAIPGETQLTPITFAKINHQFNCKPRPGVDVKGRGKMKTFVLRGRI